jgi:hypothetical protein
MPQIVQQHCPLGKALNIYREIGDKENEAYILEKLGNAYYCLGDYTAEVEWGVTSPSSPTKPCLKISLHTAPQRLGTCQVYLNSHLWG